MGVAPAAGRRRRADGQLLFAGPASGLAAAAAWAGPAAGLWWGEAARRAAARRSSGTGSRDGRRIVARTARHGGCAGESEVREIIFHRM